VSYHYGFLVESMVAILLLLTILYCVRLSNQLRLLKADEQSLRATIAELITATEIAERAIGGLKSAMRDGEQSLAHKLERAENLSTEIDHKLVAGDDLLKRLIKIVGVQKDKTQVAPDARLVAAAAEAFAKRTESRLGGIAA
jgi:Domain of unknown function (DUF6468)